MHRTRLNLPDAVLAVAIVHCIPLVVSCGEQSDGQGGGLDDATASVGAMGTAGTQQSGPENSDDAPGVTSTSTGTETATSPGMTMPGETNPDQTTADGTAGASGQPGLSPGTGGALASGGGSNGDSLAGGESGGMDGSGGAVGGASGSGGTGGVSMPDMSTSGAGDTGVGGASGADGMSTGGGGEANAGGTGGSSNAAGGSECPDGVMQTLSVARDGSGDFSSVQAAIDASNSGSAMPTRIDIGAGVYEEKVDIDRSHLCLVGESAGTTILSYNDSNSAVGSTSGSYSVLVSGDDFTATQLTFQNTYGTGSQAVALRTTGERLQFRDCRFIGNQDTLYTHQGSAYFRDCYVEGTVDYIFGYARAIFDNCEMHNVGDGSAVVAPNTPIDIPFGIVFLGGRFTAESGVDGVALARPWGADGAAAFLNSELGSHISTEGFTDMSGNNPANARFGEYQSTGAGANASARPSYQMDDAEALEYTLENVYGGWVPSYSE